MLDVRRLVTPSVPMDEPQHNGPDLAFSEDTFFRDVERYLQDGGDPHYVVPENGRTLLHYAAEYLNAEAIDSFCAAGLDVNARDLWGQTPLLIAIDSEVDAANQTGRPIDFNAARVLVANGADLDAAATSGRTPLALVALYEVTSLFNELVLKTPRIRDVH